MFFEYHATSSDSIIQQKIVIVKKNMALVAVGFRT
jgi:hypothetical protein